MRPPPVFVVPPLVQPVVVLWVIQVSGGIEFELTGLLGALNFAIQVR